MIPTSVTMVEVGPRDGFQPIERFIPTDRKIALIDQLYDAGVRRMEATAFVSPRAVPQMADAPELLMYLRDKPGLDVQVLVPSQRQAERALAADATHLAFVLSASEAHNQSNVRRSPAESVEDLRAIVAMLPEGTELRINLATSFDCPFNGPVSAEQTLNLVETLLAAAPEAEVALCDTTGRVTPDRVGALFRSAKARLPQARWAFHGHDTYGLGVANVLAALGEGVDVVDASFAGMGGCPFAPGATGNVATEDVVWTLAAMGVRTGIDLERLLQAAGDAATLPGASVGGRVRDALSARSCQAAMA